MERNEQKWVHMMVDYRRFGGILLALGVLFAIGLYVPFDGKSEQNVAILIVLSLFSIVFSMLSFRMSLYARRQLEKEHSSS